MSADPTPPPRYELSRILILCAATAPAPYRYHLTAGEGTIGRNPGWRSGYVAQHACYALTSRWIKLNGVNLTVSLKGVGGPGPMPSLAPEVVADGSAPVEIAGCSYGFVVLPGASAAACH